MLDRSLAALNDLLHAAIVGAVLVVSTLGLSEELAGWDSDQVLSIAAGGGDRSVGRLRRDAHAAGHALLARCRHPRGARLITSL